MTERVGILEAELEGKKGDEGEVKRLREEIVALEASRADEVEELERQVSRLMASREKEEEVRALRKKIDEMAATMESTLGEMRQVEDSLRAKLRAAEADAVKGERLSAAREELEARLADSEATLAAEKSRLTAEAEAAAERADAEAGELRSKLNALKETLESQLAASQSAVDHLLLGSDFGWMRQCKRRLHNPYRSHTCCYFDFTRGKPGTRDGAPGAAGGPPPSAG